MSAPLEVPVVSKNGVRGKVLTASRLLDTRPSKTVIFETGKQAEVPSRHLLLRPNGTYYLDLTVDPRPVAESKAPEPRPAAPEPASHYDDEIVVPRIEERAEVTRRTVETGRVRVSKSESEETVRIDEPSVYEEYDVEHVPINRVVEDAEPTRIEGDVTVVPVYEEEVVKRLVLKEEIRLTRKRRVEHNPQDVTLRKESVRVDRAKS